MARPDQKTIDSYSPSIRLVVAEMIDDFEQHTGEVPGIEEMRQPVINLLFSAFAVGALCAISPETKIGKKFIEMKLTTPPEGEP